MVFAVAILDIFFMNMNFSYESIISYKKKVVRKSNVASFELERTKDVKLKFNVIILKRRSRKMTTAILNNSMFNHILR